VKDTEPEDLIRAVRDRPRVLASSPADPPAKHAQSGKLRITTDALARVLR
jgi:hypothetical protein